MAKPIMIQGTMSNVGKSLLTAGLCRIFAQDGYKTAPFKSQNMALNSGVTSDGLEMGRAQIVQAEAAGIEPEAAMNPILLKPTSDVGSQVIVNGTPIGTMKAAEYFKYKKQLVPDIMRAYQSLDGRFDIIVIEGAGSPAEINLKAFDIVNMGMAEMADSPVLLVGDIDRGGVFAQLYGTVALLDENERRRIKGLIINKFRGDAGILKPGLEPLEKMCGTDVLGIVPYMRVSIDDEDSLSERFLNKDSGKIDFAVIRLPRISNFTDFHVFEAMDGVAVRYVESSDEIGTPDCLFIPGTKNTIEDMKFLKNTGMAEKVIRLARQGIPVVGICGGFQMMGSVIKDPDNAESGGSTAGLGLIDMETVFSTEKKRERISGTFSVNGGIFKPLDKKIFSGYEIHMGASKNVSNCVFTGNNLLGTYVHGIFDDIAEEFVKAVMPEYKSIGFDFHKFKEEQYNLLADGLRSSLDIERIYKIIGVRG